MTTHTTVATRNPLPEALAEIIDTVICEGECGGGRRCLMGHELLAPAA